MRKTSVALMIAALSLAPCALIAGTAEVQVSDPDNYYYIGTPKSPTTQYNPTDSSPFASGWAPDFDSAAPYPLTNLAVNNGDDIVLARRNYEIPSQTKYFSVYFRYTGTIDPDSIVVGTGSVSGHVSDTTTVHKIIANGICWITVKLDHQPDWEWIRFRATTAGTLTNVTWHTRCYPMQYNVTRVPMLTQVGTLVLVLLLIGTAGWILWKKRACASA